MGKIVEKKILPEYFNEVIHDRKKFEIRKDEDNLQIGDAVVLREWDGKNIPDARSAETLCMFCVMCRSTV